MYARSDVPHLGNHTNNRLETSWGHIKDILKQDMALDECVDTLMFLQAVAEMEYAKKITEVGQMRYEGADNELQKLASEVSSHAYRLVEKQYWIAMDRNTRYDMRELHPTMFELTSGSDGSVSCHVNTSKYRCSCVFMSTILLPCRHVMYWHLTNNNTAIPICHIALRWKLSCRLNQPVEVEDVPDNGVVCTKFQVRESAMTAKQHQVLNGSTNYKYALQRGKNIADIKSRNGTFVSGQMMEALDKFEDIVKDGVAPFVGHEGHWIDPLSQVSSLDFMTDPTAETIERVRYDNNSADEELLSTQQASGSQDSSTTGIKKSQATCDVPPATCRVPPVTRDVCVVPSVTSGAPGVTRSAPSVTNVAPQDTSGVPPVTSGVPAVTRGVPPVTSDVPPVTSDVTRVTRDVLPVTSGVPRVQSDVPAVVESCRDTDRTPQAAVINDEKSLDKGSAKPSKRPHETSGSSETTESFRITKSTSSRGRPKVRKQQKNTKKQRIGEGRKTANNCARKVGACSKRGEWDGQI